MTASEQPFFLNFILSFKFCGDVLLIFFISPFRNLSMPGILQAPKSCPVARCSYVGPNWALSVHWWVAHEDRSILFLCPLPGCSYQTPHQHNLRTHWDRVHGATRPTSPELRTLPLLADFAVNRNRVDPGECCPPVPPCGCQSGACPIATSIPCLSGCRARFQKRSARDRLRYDPVILIGRSHSTNADHDRLIRSRKYETKQFIANWIMT